MALRFRTRLGEYEENHVIDVRKPEELKMLNDKQIYCVRLEADGFDLLLIKDRFTNLPISPHRSSMVWMGDFASFIAANLYL